MKIKKELLPLYAKYHVITQHLYYYEVVMRRETSL